ncbi:MAG: InlB B-repeat-containing protein [Spirochaetaceae bacterium]|jgi:hypothetical protein|nr:InlB B-repeat-containing protein [Spirochaetaceae bacterium]
MSKTGKPGILALIIGSALVLAFTGCGNPIMAKLLEPLAPKTVSYNLNGGTGPTPAAQKVKAGESVTLPGGEGLAKSGCAFGGWNTRAGRPIPYSPIPPCPP